MVVFKAILNNAAPFVSVKDVAKNLRGPQTGYRNTPPALFRKAAAGIFFWLRFVHSKFLCAQTSFSADQLRTLSDLYLSLPVKKKCIQNGGHGFGCCF